MYKSGKQWCAAKITTIAGVALFSTMILGGNANANADSVNSSSVAQVTSKASSSVLKASAVTRAASSSSNSGINVNVPSSGLDSAVANAKKDGVQVTQGATQSSSTTADKASSAEQSIANDYKNQTNAINQADAKQKQVNATNSHIHDTVDHSGLDSAVKNAQSVGVTVSKTADQQVTGSASDWQSKENQIKSDYQNQTNALNQVANKQKQINADNSHIGSEGDHSALDSAIANAKKAGANVVQDADQNVGSDKNASQWQDVNNQINSDYQNEVNQINSQMQQYQSALNTYNQQMQQYQQAMDQYNTALADYNKKKQAYDSAVNKLSGDINTNGIDTSTLKQHLNWDRSPNATVTVKALSNDVNITQIPGSQDSFDKQYVGWDSNQVYLIHANQNQSVNGAFAQATYSGDLNMTYNGQKISKVVVTFSNLNNNNGNLNLTNPDSGDPRNFQKGSMTPYIRIGNDPTDDVWYGNAQSVDETYQFYDANGNLINFNNDAYITVGSLNAYNNHLEKAQLLSGGKAIALAGSNIGVHGDNTIYSNGNQADQSKWDKGLDTPNAYYGAGVFQLSGNSVSLRLSVDRTYKCSQLGPGDTASMTKDNHPGIWAMIGTTLPQTPNDVPTPPKKPTPPTKPTVPTIHYHYDKADMQKEQAQAISYHYDDMNLTPLANVQATYHHDALNVSPVETKNVDVNGQSVNGKEVVEGEDVTFPLSSAPLPANRVDDVKTLSFTDTLDKNVKFDGWKAVDDKGNDVSKDFTMSQNGQTVTFTATSAFMNQINANKGSQFDLPTIDINATATASGVKINNTFQIHVNGNAWPSNTVTFSTPGNPQPVKKVDNTNGQDIDGSWVEPGQEVDFNLTFDLSSDKNVVLDKNVIAKGLGMTDSVDKRLTPDVNGIVITDANGKTVNKDLFNITDNGNTVTISVKDSQAFLNTYGGQKLNIKLPAKVNTGITGNIPNTVTEIHFGNNEKSNQVVVYVPAPHKDVVAGTIQGTGSASINGEDVVAGQDVTFTLTTSDLPAGRKADIKSYSITDELDPNFDYSGFRAFLGSKDVTDEFTPSLVKGQDGKWTLTLTANADMLKQMNADKSKAFTIPTFDLYGKAINSGVKIQNTYVEHLNGNSYDSNTVSITTTPKETPVKTVTNSQGQNADNGNVERGDSLIYHVSMDLTGMPSNMVLTPSTIQKGLWVSDKMPNGVTVNTSGIRVNSADGKDVTSDFDITYQDGVVKVAAKDPASIIKQFGNTKLSITIPTTVNDNFTGDIDNTAIQNTFGNEVQSNTVVDHVPPMKPTKDVCVDVGNQTSLDNKNLTLGEVFNYKLNSSTRSADYVGTTTEWGGKDFLDTKHVEFTGQWKVYADHDFVTKDGQTIKAGTDISKYFTMTYNTKTGEFDIEANKDFLDIMNLPANKKTAQGWSVFIQCKAIADGEADNVWTEMYNNKAMKSNVVKNNIVSPAKPATPAKPQAQAPQPQKVVKKQAPATPAKATPAPAKATPTPAQPVLATPAPVKETPAPEKQAMPQTGESENDEGAIIGLAMLGAVGTMGLALRKKRFE